MCLVTAFPSRNPVKFPTLHLVFQTVIYFFVSFSLSLSHLVLCPTFWIYLTLILWYWVLLCPMLPLKWKLYLNLASTQIKKLWQEHLLGGDVHFTLYHIRGDILSDVYLLVQISFLPTAFHLMVLVAIRCRSFPESAVSLGIAERWFLEFDIPPTFFG